MGWGVGLGLGAGLSFITGTYCDHAYRVDSKLLLRGMAWAYLPWVRFGFTAEDPRYSTTGLALTSYSKEGTV